MKKSITNIGFFVVLVLIVTVVSLNLSRSLSVSDTQETVTVEQGVLDKFSSYKAATVERKIQKAIDKRLALLAAAEEAATAVEELDEDSYRKIFANTCIVGDSLMNGLEIYGILNSDTLITQVSASLYHLEENVSSVIAANPKNVILHYGLNMLEEEDYMLENFIEMYKELILEIKEGLPKSRIIVSLIFPVDSTYDLESVYERIPAYNSAMVTMCNEIGVETLDSSSLLTDGDDYYDGDGIHVTASFYSEQWLPFVYKNKGIS